MSICQSLTRSGSTPRSQRLATAWATRCIGRWAISVGCPEWRTVLSGGRGRTNMARYWMLRTQSHSIAMFHNVSLAGWSNWLIELLKPRETAASSRLTKPSACRSNSARALARLRISRSAWCVFTNPQIYLCIKAPCGQRHNWIQLIWFVGSKFSNFGTRTKDNWLVCSQVASNCN